MTHIASARLGAIIDHYSDVIEGGSAYNSGDSLLGIPGRYSNDVGLRNGDDTPLTATAAGTTTTVVVSGGNWPQSRWVKAQVAGYYLLCTSGDADAVDESRRVTGWNNTTKTFTTDAFPAAPGDGATFDVLQGFKRLPNTVDINDEESASLSPDGYDRTFALRLLPVLRRDWFGDGTETWDGTLELTLRLVKRNRSVDIAKSVIENLNIISSVLARTGDPDHRESSYVRYIMPPDAPVIDEDAQKVVAVLEFPITYTFDRTF